MNELFEAAVELARQGIRVFPLKPRSKIPLTRNGFKDATCDVEKVKRWWTRWPDANIGIVPGPSGLVGFDVDGPEGEATARSLGLFEVPTLRVRTGREDGGIHLYFRRPAALDHIPNQKLGPTGKLEVRGDAGY